MTNANEPINVTTFRDGEVNNTGLSKRECFAAMALQGLMAVNDKGTNMSIEECMEIAAKFSVIAADALINALNQPLK